MTIRFDRWFPYEFGRQYVERLKEPWKKIFEKEGIKAKLDIEFDSDELIFLNVEIDCTDRPDVILLANIMNYLRPH